MKALEHVVQQIDPLIDEDPDRASVLYETFLAGCYAKTAEIDDSSGEFGNLMQRLCCRWVRAQQSARQPAKDTVETLVRWMDADDYGYTYQIERHLAEALDDAGRKAFVQTAKARFEQASKEAERRKGELGADASQQDCADVLRALYEAQQDAFSYIRLCQRMGMRGKECLVIADIFQAKDETGQALSWVRKGLEIGERRDFATYDLKKRERALLTKLGRPRKPWTWPGKTSMPARAPAATKSSWSTLPRPNALAGTSSRWTGSQPPIFTQRSICTSRPERRPAWRIESSAPRTRNYRT